MRKLKKIFNKKVLITILICSALLITFIVSATNFAYAADRRTYSKDSMTKEWSMSGQGLEQTEGHADNIKVFGKEASRIGINQLFGCSDRSTSYYGERPLGGINTGAWKEYRAINETWINGHRRQWSWNPDEALPDGFEYEWQDNETNDLHAANMVGDPHNIFSNIFQNFNILYGLFSGLNALFSIAMNGLIDLANFDINGILDAFNLTNNSGTGVADVITHLFISKDGKPSVVLLIAALLFIVSLVILIIKRVTAGTTSFREIVKEFVFLLLAAAVAAVCLTGGAITLTKTLSQFSTNLISAITKEGGETLDLFVYESNDNAYASRDAANTQKGICSKVFIDLMIRNQFNCSPDELTLYGNGKAKDNWDLDDNQVKALIRKIQCEDEDSQGEHVFDVSTGQNKGVTSSGGGTNSGSPNLGYFWYCATCVDSSVSSGFKIGADNKAELIQGDKNTNLYVMDFLAGVDAMKDGSPKAQAIMSQMVHPVRDIGAMAMCMLVTLATAFALVCATIYCLMGKIIFNIGAVFLPIVPIMLLIPFGNLRQQVKPILMTWLIAILKMVVGQVFIILLITFSAALCQSGSMGMFLDIIFLIAMAFFSKNIFTKLNDIFSKHEIGATRAFNNGFNKASNAAFGVLGGKTGKNAFNKVKDKLSKDGNKENVTGQKNGNLGGNKNKLSNADNKPESKAGKKFAKMSNSAILKTAHIKDPELLKRVKGSEELTKKLENSRHTKFGHKLRSGAQKFSNSTAGKILSHVPVANGVLAAGLNAVDRTGAAFEKGGVVSRTRKAVADFKLSQFHVTTTTNGDGKIHVKKDGIIKTATKNLVGINKKDDADTVTNFAESKRGEWTGRAEKKHADDQQAKRVAREVLNIKQNTNNSGKRNKK